MIVSARKIFEKLMKQVATFILIALLTVPHSLAQQDFSALKFEILEIEDAVNNADFIFAHEKALPLANAGHPQARFILGTLYQNGWGVSQNFPAAIDWYIKAGEAGSGNGAYNAAVLTLEGRNEDASLERAITLFKMGAALDHALSYYTLGIIYAGGNGVDADQKLSFDYFFKAGNLGHPTAMYNVARHFISGIAVAQDYAKAREWLAASVTYHHHPSQFEFAKMHLNGLGGAADPVEGYKWLLLAQDNDQDAYIDTVNETGATLSTEQKEAARQAAFEFLSTYPKQAR